MKQHATLSKHKECSLCSASFVCGETIHSTCWCNAYPPIFELDFSKDCLCKECLHKATKEKINEYVKMISLLGIKNNSAAKLKTSDTPVLGIDYYLEKGLWVFTAWHHLRRGTCCKSACRHCPYGFKK